MISNVELSTKERLLLEDQKSHEEQCVLKYDNYSNLASDTELKTLFKSISQKEREHLQSINQLLSGKIPSMGQGQSGQMAQMSQQGQSSQGGISSQQSAQGRAGQGGAPNSMLSDKDICTDMLNTEKYISGTYDTAIFEFKNPQIRDVLNHIQKEEQKHGESIFAYMQSKGMYSAQ
jgi:spore coat protein CotF